MGYVYVYDKDADDLDNTGLVGALQPIECTHEEEAGGVSAVTLKHPYDEGGRWKALKEGNILACECRVRTPPDLIGGVYSASVQVWTVKTSGLTKAQLRVFTKENKNKKSGTLIQGREVYVLQTGENRYEVQYEKRKKKKKQYVYVWKKGWVDPAALTYTRTQTIEDSTNGILSVCQNGDSRTQYFRIQSVNYDMNAQEIEVYAPHISFDLSRHLTRFIERGTVTGLEAAEGILGGMDYEADIGIETDIEDEATGIEWEDLTVTAAIQDPEQGFAARYGAEVLRDNDTVYLLHDVDSGQGIRVEHRKNLTGANLTVNYDGLVTAIKPRGEDAKGNTLYLTDSPTGSGNYVLSDSAEDYGVHAMVLDVSEAKVDKKKGVTVQVARERMRQAALDHFDDQGDDQPKIELTVNFVELGKTVEYADYAGLETAFLYDTVVVAAAEYGIEATAKVTRMTWDCLDERITQITLGEVRRTGKVYSWQITGGIRGDKLMAGSVSLDALSDDAGRYTLEIVSSSGSEVSGTTTLAAHVYYGTEDVTDEFDASEFTWYRDGETAASGVKELEISFSGMTGAAGIACVLADDTARGEITLFPRAQVGARNYIPESKTMVLDGVHGIDDQPTTGRVGFAVVGTATAG